MTRTCAVIVAGGCGSRFGNARGKLLVDVAGRPLLTWAVEAFDRSALTDAIVVVCQEERTDEMRRCAIEPFGFSSPVSFAPAGGTRQDSSRAGVMAAAAGSFDIVAIHDGARPLIRPETIDAALGMLEAAPELDGVVCGQPAVDTLKLMDGERIESTPPRSSYWTVQTPQIFRVPAMLSAYELADAEGFAGTDDSSVVERAGGNVVCMQSPRDNIKVTMPEDLFMADALLRARLEQADA